MFEGLIYQLGYKLERHRLFNIRLRDWLILGCLLLPLALWLRLWDAKPIIVGVVTVAAIGVLAATWWAGRQRYVRFVEQAAGQISGAEPDANSAHSSPDQQMIISPLPAMSKVPVHATGFFEVSGMRRYFVETLADYTTFETREHCLMSYIPRTRFLLVGTSNRVEAGWWYTFFQPAMIRAVQSGRLYFGMRPRSALRLVISLPDNSRHEVVHLSFDDDATRSLVLADLCQDARLDAEP